ncbi:MAG: adenylosuccinate synthetase [Euryarchaeota archaeon]|nr:adenylosuccinate synthetase [Euryarchaeota archaeon]
MVTVVVGGQWGDEGKGKVISYLCMRDKPHVIARAGVGPNAGHTVMYRGRKYPLRLTPSGFLHSDARLLIGAGVLVNPKVMLEEIEQLGIEQRIGIDRRCGIIEEEHISRDRGSEHLAGKIGSTGTGCGPANMDRAARKLRLAQEVPELEPYLTDVAEELNRAADEGRRVLIESSQGFGLSLFYGTYPYVTSKDTTAGMACVDVGIGPRKVKEVMVVFKSFPTRVGSGPFPTEMPQEEAERLGIVEYGTVTGRRRRIGWFDYEMARYAAMLNSASQIALTCIDYLDRSCRGVRSYEELSEKAKKFVEEVERRVGVPVTIISTGPEVEDTIDLREEKLG